MEQTTGKRFIKDNTTVCIPAFKDLEIINGLFDIDLSADEIWEQGKVPEHA
ncbi:hypothetical protein [Acetivibrio ethanolgignens]|uniref:hypothetical protein n=1 Tax=Acetivibrio ethanolgignens TaxID=290052 RepID=UPI0012DDF3B2|nr:hypothetical protein [Acetivibrio ethanolgignens]